jgi:hypothetical protein
MEQDLLFAHIPVKIRNSNVKIDLENATKNMISIIAPICHGGNSGNKWTNTLEC